MTIYDVAQLSGKAYYRKCNVGFRSTGIRPFNIEIFTDDAFISDNSLHWKLIVVPHNQRTTMHRFVWRYSADRKMFAEQIPYLKYCGEPCRCSTKRKSNQLLSPIARRKLSWRIRNGRRDKDRKLIPRVPKVSLLCSEDVKESLNSKWKRRENSLKEITDGPYCVIKMFAHDKKHLHSIGVNKDWPEGDGDFQANYLKKW